MCIVLMQLHHMGIKNIAVDNGNGTFIRRDLLSKVSGTDTSLTIKTFTGEETFEVSKKS